MCANVCVHVRVCAHVCVSVSWGGFCVVIYLMVMLITFVTLPPLLPSSSSTPLFCIFMNQHDYVLFVSPFGLCTLFRLLSPPPLPVLARPVTLSVGTHYTIAHTLPSNSSLPLAPCSILLHYSDWVLFGMACVVPAYLSFHRALWSIAREVTPPCKTTDCTRNTCTQMHNLPGHRFARRDRRIFINLV